MAGTTNQIHRREFLKFIGAHTAAALVPVHWFMDMDDHNQEASEWPRLSLDDLPDRIAAILDRTPQTYIGANGYLQWVTSKGGYRRNVPLARTLWNIERSSPSDRLKTDRPWGIVLHWYGDKENFDRSIKGYLRGFDSLRDVEGHEIRTSAHFLVGDAPLSSSADQAISIIQTQAPDKDGIPFLGSHLRSLDYLAHQEKKQYFVRALYQLSHNGYNTHTLLQEFFDGPVVDPNKSTIAIEATGYKFDSPETAPSDQQIANVLAVVWAIMRRYGILATNILGHQEIQLGKADPGKKFLALMRYLIGIKALLENDPTARWLVFGPFQSNEEKPQQAVEKYFNFIRDYLVLVGSQRSVYEWEADSKYWLVQNHLSGQDAHLQFADRFIWPLSESFFQNGYYYLNPDFHEGVDLYTRRDRSIPKMLTHKPVRLAANGVCVFIGETCGHCQGKTVIFRHRQPDGAEVISAYNHLGEVGNLHVGDYYPAEYRVGSIRSERSYYDPYLHFAIAYGATWDTNLSHSPDNPLNAGRTWIRQRFINPLEYLNLPKVPADFTDNRNIPV